MWRWGRFLVFPLLVLIAGITLTAWGVNGSSIGVLSDSSVSDPALIAGTPRFIRGDEYRISTPAQVGNVAKGFPQHAWVGLTDTDFHVTSLDVPTRSWLTPFQPQTWPLLTLRTEIGFAGFWWMLFVVPLIGVYVLLISLRAKPWLAATVSIMVSLGPIIAWWTSSAPGLIVGYLCAAGALIILASRVRPVVLTVPLALLAGAFGCAAFLVLYPPWFLSVGLVVGAAVVGGLIDRRVRLSQAIVAIAIAAMVVVGVLGQWAAKSADALAALTGTYYPGSRVSPPGQGLAADLFAAPFNPIISANPEVMLPGQNESEFGAPWLVFPVVALLLAIVLWQWWRGPRWVRQAKAAGEPRRARRPFRDAAAVLVAAVMVLEVAWMLLPLNPWIGRLTLLDRVPSWRVTVALGLGFGILLHLLADRIRFRFGSWSPWALLVAGGVSVWLVAWAAPALVDADVQWKSVALPIAGVVTLAVILMAFRAPAWARTIPALFLVAVVVANFVIVNPLYLGLGELRNGPLAHELQATADREGPSRWVSMAGDPVSAVIAASPNEVLSGMTYYPTAAVWVRLAPTQERLWNNFSKYVWVYRPDVNPSEIQELRGTLRKLTIDICSPQVDFLKIRYVVTEPLKHPVPCLVPVTEFSDLGRRLIVNRRIP